MRMSKPELCACVEQLAVLHLRPAHFRSRRYRATDEQSAKRPRHTMIEENPPHAACPANSCRAYSSTARACSRRTPSNASRNSSKLTPSSRFANSASTGTRVLRKQALLPNALGRTRLAGFQARASPYFDYSGHGWPATSENQSVSARPRLGISRAALAKHVLRRWQAGSLPHALGQSCFAVLLPAADVLEVVLGGGGDQVAGVFLLAGLA